MKRLACVVLSLCAAFTLAACGREVKVDTSEWRYYSLEEAGVTLLLPGGLERESADGTVFRASGSGLRLEVDACEELFADAAALADYIGAQTGRETETVPLDGAELVRVLLPEDSCAAEYYAVGPAGDACHILLASDGEGKNRREKRRAAAVLAAAVDSLRAGAALPADVRPIRVSGRPERPMPDCLVPANRRNPLPDGWADSLDLARSVNSRGETVTAERGVWKAFFALRRALAAEGVYVEAERAYLAPGAGYGDGCAAADCPEHQTGLALDLYLRDGGEEETALWEKVHARLAGFGFILRYPEGGEYETGCRCEPRHVRYVGAGAAEEIAARGITLEEYLGLDPAAVDYLVLVNAKNALPEDWEGSIELVYLTNRHGEEIGVERTAFAAYCRLRDELAEEGVHLDVNSAYRSVAAQQALAESYTRKYGADYVRTYVAVPGYSEHHTGLALDLYLESPDVWAKIHAKLAECGFILRYPEGKEAITGYGYEPWHVRYVGVGPAEEIAARGLTLEEYLGAA